MTRFVLGLGVVLAVSGCAGRTASSHLTSAASATAGTASAAPASPASPPATPPGTTSSPGPIRSFTPMPTFTPRPARDSGVEGTVQAGPTCPVERADHPCPPRPVAADVVVKDGTGRVVAVTRSGQDGRFRVAVAPGRYVVTADTHGQWPRCSPTDVTVYPKAYTHATVDCDTGIR